MTIFGFSMPDYVVLLGAITGMTYGILAAGLVLVYRSSKIINFAQGEIGALGAALLGLLVTRGHVPYWVAFGLALILSASTGALSEVVVVRRLRNAPTLMTLVATLGVAAFLLPFAALLNGQIDAGTSFPQPSLMPSFNVGPLTVTSSYSAMLILTPVIVIALALFLRKTRYGLAIRAAADDRDAARLAGVSAGRMSTLTWSIAGAIAAFTVMLVLPTIGFASSEFLGPGLLMRALTAAVIAGMTSIPIALVAGVFIGVAEQVLIWNYPQGGQFEAILFVVVLVTLLIRRRQFGRSEERATWAAVQPWGPLPDSFRKVWAIRNLGWIIGAVGLVAGCVIPLIVTNATSIILTSILAFALVGLSVGIITGLGGQLTLGQFALAGVGATISYYVSAHTSFVFGFIAAGLGAAAVSLVIGLPALRIRGIMLAVITLGFALACADFFFEQPWMLGAGGVASGTPRLGSFSFDTGRRYYYLALAVFVIGYILSRNIWRGGVGLRLRAQRDNEDGARAFTVQTTAVKLQAFVLAGFLAGIAGAVYGGSLSILPGSAFPVSSSIDATAAAVLGGIGLLAGPLLGALYIIGVPQFVPLDSAGLAATAAGWLFLILYFPGGIARAIHPVREWVVDRLAKQSGLDPAAERAAAMPAASTAEFAASSIRLAAVVRKPVATDAPLLEVAGLTKRYGGVTAVDDVSLEVHPGETLGLIGPNGAGKTTLLEMIGGFVPPDSGRVVFQGADVSSLTAAQRGRRGLVRSFQDARLFPTLTVLETVCLSMERESPTRVIRSTLGFQRPERRKSERALELVSLMGLQPWKHVQIQHLSTGTRRVTELACLVALSPSLLLLDEPSSGIAQRETEALAGLLVRLKDRLDVTLVVVEHDMPLIMGMSDRIIAMHYGRVIANGTPETVKNDATVIESYLGLDNVSILRSSEVQGNPLAAEGAASS